MKIFFVLNRNQQTADVCALGVWVCGWACHYVGWYIGGFVTMWVGVAGCVHAVSS